MRNAILAALATAAAFGVAATAPVLAQPSTNTCFFVTQWDGGWKSPDDHTIYVRVSNSRIFRLDTVSACPELTEPGAMLITLHNTATICRPIDWNLRVSQGRESPAVPCLVKTMTLLTPAQVAALPKSARP